MSKDPNTKVRVTASDETRQGFNQAEASAKSFAGRMRGHMQGIGASIKGLVAGPLGAAALAAGLGKFFQHSINEAKDAQAEFARLSTAIENTGGKVKDLAPAAQEAISALSRMSGKDGGEINDALANLINLTGDFQGSLAALPTVMDLAAARQIDLGTASDVVAKAFNGNAAAIKRLGIEAKAGETPFQALQARFAGMAKAEGETLTGTLGRIRNGFNDVAEALGNAIIGSDGMSGSGSVLVDALAATAEWIEKNSDVINYFIGVIGKVGSVIVSIIKLAFTPLRNAIEGVKTAFTALSQGTFSFSAAWKLSLGQAVMTLGQFLDTVLEVGELLTKLFGIEIDVSWGRELKAAGQEMVREAKAAMGIVETVVTRGGNNRASGTGTGTGTATGNAATGGKKADPNKELQDRIRLLGDTLKLEDRRAAAMAELLALYRAYQRVSKDATKTDQERLAALDAMAAVDRELNGQASALYNRSTNGIVRGVSTQVFSAGQSATQIPLGNNQPSDVSQGFRTGMGDMLEGFDPNAAIDSVRELNTAIGELSGGAIAGLGDAFADAFASAIDGSDNLAVALINGAKQAVAASAMAKGRESFLDAAKALAQGILGDPKAFVAAAKFTAAGAGYMALAAAMGGSGGGSRGPGSAGGASAGGINRTAQSVGGKGQVIVNFPKGAGLYDFNDPAQQKQFVKMFENYTGRDVLIQGS